MKRSAQVVVGTMIAAVVSGMAFGQVKSDRPVKSVHISGRVLDAGGTPVRDVTVKLKSAGSTETTDSTKTSETGEYTFLVVPHRSYELHFESPGFRRETKLVTADKDTDVGHLVLSVAQGGGPSSVVMEPPDDLPGSADATLMVGQAQTKTATKTVRVSGRLLGPNEPIRHQPITLRGAGQEELAKTETDEGGRFTFPAVRPNQQYDIYIPEPGVQPNYRLVARIEVEEGWDVDFGDIAEQPSTHNLQGPHSPLDFPLGELHGPVTVANSISSSDSNPSSVQSAKTLYIAAIFIGSDGLVSIVQSDGKLVQPSKEKEQVGGRSPMFSDDRKAVGWLVDSDFCCTSYPIQLMLVVYTPGKPLRHFTGDGRAIFRWGFVDGGKRVAFYQDFLHGTPGPHYELHDVESERLIEKWDGDLTPRAPAWTRGLQH